MAQALTWMHGGRLPRCVATVDKSFTYYLIQLMTSGGIDLWCDSTHHTMRGLHIWFCRPGLHYHFHEAPRGRPWNHRYLAFTGPRAVMWDTNGLIPHQPQGLSVGSPASWARRFDRLLDESQAAGRWNQLRAENLLEGMLIDMAEQRDTMPHAPPAWLLRVIECLRASRDVDYHALAERENMSLSTLQRGFRAAMGLTLHAFRIQQRLAHARHLLGETDMPIKWIADQLGYQDVFYFTRQFTRCVGVAPGIYRRTRQRL